MTFKNKEAVITITAQLVQLIGGLVLIKLLSTELTKADYAVYALLISLVAFISTLPFTSLSQGYMRYVSIYSNKNQLQPFYVFTLITTLVILLFYLLIAFLMNAMFLEGTFWGEYFYLIAALVFTEIFKITYRSFENAARNRVGFANSIIAEYSLKIIILVIAFQYWIVGLEAIIAAFIFANLVSILLVTRFKFLTHWQTSRRFNKVVLKRILTFSAPLIVWGLFGWSRDMSGRWILDIYTTKEQVSAFALMASIAMIGPGVVQSLIGAYLVPILYEKENHQTGYTRQVLIKLIPILLVGLVIATGLLYIMKTWVVIIIAEEKYIEDAWMLPIMFFAYGLFVISMMSTYEIFAHNQTRLMLWPNVISGLVALVLGLLLTQYFGLHGMVIAFVAAYLSYAMITFQISWKFKPV